MLKDIDETRNRREREREETRRSKNIARSRSSDVVTINNLRLLHIRIPQTRTTTWPLVVAAAAAEVNQCLGLSS